MADELENKDDTQDDSVAGDEGDVNDEDVSDEDDSGEDEAGADEADDDQTDEGDEEPVKTRSRNQSARSKSDETLRSATVEAENIRLRAQLEEAQKLQRDRATDEAAEKAKLDAMEPAQRAEYIAHKTNAETQQALAIMKFQSADAADFSAYQAKVARSDVHSRYAGKVEEMLAGMRKKGMTAPREEVLKYIIGNEALQKLESAGGKIKVASTQRAQNAKGKSVSARGDVNGVSRRSSGKTAEERLEGVLI